jgi:hypothetical protein
MSKFQQELIEADFMRSHQVTVRANIVLTSMYVTKSLPYRMRQNVVIFATND